MESCVTTLSGSFSCDVPIFEPLRPSRSARLTTGIAHLRVVVVECQTNVVSVFVDADDSSAIFGPVDLVAPLWADAARMVGAVCARHDARGRGGCDVIADGECWRGHSSTPPLASMFSAHWLAL